VTDTHRPCRLRFGIYEIDARSGELWRDGVPAHLPPQPFKVLWLLASRAGDVVTREEIREALWGHDTFVDFDGGLNFCINQIRKALRDSAESPRFIHTLPRRGYRFIATVEPVAPSPSASAVSAAPAGVDAVAAPAVGEAASPSMNVDDDDGSGGTPPRGHAAHLYEVVAARDANGGSRWRSPAAAVMRLAAAPVALRDSSARELDAVAPVAERQSALESAAVGDPHAWRPGGWSTRPPAWAWPVLASAMVVAVLAVLAVAGRAHVDPSYVRLTFRRGSVASARFGVGGEIVYSASWDGTPRRTYVSRSGETVSRPLDLPARAVVQSVLATGEIAVLLLRDPGTVLALAPPSGGTPRELADMVWTADVSPDGTRVAAVRGDGPEARVELPLGHEVHRTTAKLSALRLSPAGDRVALLEHPVPGDDRGSVITIDAAGHRRVLSADWASLEGLAWAPDGAEVWFTGAKVGADSTLNAVTLSGVERVVSRGPGRLVLRDIRGDGAVLLERTARRMELRGLFPGAEAERDLSWLDLSLVTDLARDGRTLVFSESGEGGGAGYGVFLRRTDGSAPMKLGEGRAMGLSPDGQWVLSIPLFGPPRVMALPTGAGEARPLGAGLERQAWAGWFPDSRHVVFTAAEPGRPLAAYVQDLDGGPPRMVASGVALTPCLVTPDGHAVLARAAGVSGRWQLHPVEGGAARPTPLSPQERPLVFAPDGQSLFLVKPWDAAPMVIERLDLVTGARERSREITAADPAGVTRLMPPVMTPDGRYYAYSVHRILSELYLVGGLR
jgi:DNA-binding winged helix-turn-helix (wHTH) protein